MDARLPPQGLRALRVASDPDLGRQPRHDRLERHPLLRPRLREEQPRLERGPRRHQEDLRPPRHPRGGAQVPLRGRRPVRVRGRLSPGKREARGPGRDLHRHGHRPARARGHRARVLGDGHPAQRQQARGAQLGRLVGRLVRLRPRRGQGGDAAAGLLPDQHREHGPVRAHPDHRRGGLRRHLHRGLHGAGLLDRLAALGGGRDHRQAQLAGPLHDGPELVPERLQPGHQAGDRPGERDDGVGRLQPRLEADHEVPVDLPARRGRPRRGPLDRLRRRRPAPGRGREDHPRRPAHDLLDLREVDRQGRRALDLPRPARGRQGRHREPLEGRLRRADARRGVALGHLPDDPHRRVRRRRRPRGDGLEGRRRAGLLPAEPRPRRGRGLEDDRQRLHRAGHQGAADGVRGRAQPADRAADGRLDWLRRVRRLLRFASGGGGVAEPEPDWLTERRRQGASLASELALPDAKQKGWEFTDLADLDLDAYEPANGTVDLEDGGAAEAGAIVLPLDVGPRRAARRFARAPRLAGLDRGSLRGPKRRRLGGRRPRLRPQRRPGPRADRGLGDPDAPPARPFTGAP